MREGEGDWGLNVPFDFDRMRRGLLLMVWGMFLKLVIADRLGILVDTVFPEYWNYNGMQLAAAAVCFSIQIYGDFAGYSAMAIGAAQVLGFRLTDNFRQPYLSLSIREFWRRWHISCPAGSGTTSTSPWRQPAGEGAHPGEPDGHLPGQRPVAWSQLELRGLGRAARGLSDRGRPAASRPGPGLHSAPYPPGQAVLEAHAGALDLRPGDPGLGLLPGGEHRTGPGSHLAHGRRFTLSLDGITGLGLDAKDLLVAAAAVLVVFIADLLGQKMCVRDRILALPLPARWAVYYLAVFSILIFGVYGGNYDAGQFIYGVQF